MNPDPMVILHMDPDADTDSEAQNIALAFISYRVFNSFKLIKS
jgi:hypothetical protein